MTQQEPIPLTAAGREAVAAELEELRHRVRPQIVERIATTRAEGDLRENAGYHQAKEDQGRVEGRIAHLEATLGAAVIIEEGPSDGTVAIGSRVTVADGGVEVAYRIVGPVEADPAAGMISAESPVGRALVGGRAGDEVEVVTPGGSRILRIVAVA